MIAVLVGLIAAVKLNKFHLELFGGKQGNNMKNTNLEGIGSQRTMQSQPIVWFSLKMFTSISESLFKGGRSERSATMLSKFSFFYDNHNDSLSILRMSFMHLRNLGSGFVL